MSWLGDVLKFEKSKLGNMLGKVRENPEQLLLGAGDPFSAKVWSGITGKDYSPLVSQWGGATPDDYARAEAQGINTGPGRTMHDIAQTVASMYAGNYGAQQLGGLLGSGGGAAGGGANAAQEAFRASELAGGAGGTSAIPSSVNLVNAGGTMSTAGGGGLLGSANDYLGTANRAFGAANQARGLFGGGQEQQAPAPAQLGATGDPIGQMLAQQAALEEQRRQLQMRGLLYGRTA